MPERRLERGREHQLTEALQTPPEAPAGSFQALGIPDRALQALGRRVREGAYPVWAGVPGAFAAGRGQSRHLGQSEAAGTSEPRRRHYVMQGGIFAVPAWSGSLSEAEERDAELDEATLGRMQLEEQELMEEILQDERNAAFLQEAMR